MKHLKIYENFNRDSFDNDFMKSNFISIQNTCNKYIPNIIKNNDLDSLKYLILKGYDINYNMNYLLNICLSNTNIKMTKKILSLSTKPNPINSFNLTNGFINNIRRNSDFSTEKNNINKVLIFLLKNNYDFDNNKLDSFISVYNYLNYREFYNFLMKNYPYKFYLIKNLFPNWYKNKARIKPFYDTEKYNL
jgi:hypothetical protein